MSWYMTDDEWFENHQMLVDESQDAYEDSLATIEDEDE